MEEPAEIELLGFLWEYEPDGNVEHLARHDVSPDDVYAVLQSSPMFFLNLPEPTASHIMIGPDGRGRVLYIALLATPETGIWKAVTGWDSRLARRIYYSER